MNTEKIRDMVRQACLRPENVFGACFFEQHIELVAHYGVKLAAVLGADAGTVELASYLHDISAVRDAATIPDHARLGAEMARSTLAEAGYPESVCAEVARCAASHSSPVAVGSGSPEQVCVSNADAMAQIARPAYWVFYAATGRKLGFEQARAWLSGHYEANWNRLSEPARELIAERYKRAMELLSE